jgi:NAD(P)-dependent dehydrogenase (short-subunit alcohol dehydrogenase family)/aryl carrier-like protein
VANMVWPEASAPTEAARPDPGPVTVARLQGLLAPLLGVRDPTTLEPETPLLSFGLDSLTAVEFARALSRDLGRPVAPDFVYNHPTLERAVQALTTRRPAAARPDGYLLRAPRWEDVPPGRTATFGWMVAGESALAGALRKTLTADAANLLDLSALDVAPSADPAARKALFPGLLERLRGRLGTPGRITLVVPSEGAITGAVEGFATALVAEQPAWTLRTVRLDADLADPAAKLTQELGTNDDETRVRLGRSRRQALRLVPIPVRGAWRASPDATYLVTGGSRGVGALVAAHLVNRGARHLVLAARRPVMPPALAGGVARIRLRAVDLGEAAGVAALMTELRATQPPLRGIFHAAGVTADGLLAASDWDRWEAAFPAKADGARYLDSLSRQLDLENFVLFSSSTAWFGLAGTSGYAAANGFLDGLAHERRAAGLPAVSIAWGAWQGVGMAADPGLWQDGRVPSLPPDAALAALDAALASGEASVLGTNPDWHPAAHHPRLDQPMLAEAGGGA